MGARSKLNATYTAWAAVGGAVAGVVFQSRWALVVGFAVLVGLHVQAGNIRPRPHRP